MKKISALLLALATAASFGFNQHAFAKSTKSVSTSDTVQVAGYTRKDGTVVKGYTRKKSSKSSDASKTETKSAKVTETPATTAATAATTTEKTETTKVDTKNSTKTSAGKKSK
ncbi:MAG TPA: hypothetical protein V6C89_13455 [Drouetiella sp.]|jgi:hypothetical protein